MQCMMRRVLTLTVMIALLTVTGRAQSNLFTSFGQQDPQFTQYALSPASFNPAATGLDDAWLSTLLVRSQWTGLPGAPVSQNLNSSVPIYKISSGAGITIINDIAGQQRNTGTLLSYAYHKRFRSAGLSFGLSGGMTQQTINGDKLVTPTGIYGDVVFHNDPNLPVTTVSRVLPDAAAGLYFFTSDLQVGVSMQHLLLPLSASNAPDGASVQYNPTGYVYLAYGFDVGTQFRIMPNVLYKTDLNAGVIDLNALVTYDDRVLAGVSGRAGASGTMDAVSLMAGWQVSDKWLISYAYDVTLSALNTVSAGSHEVGIRYRVPVAKPRAGKMVNNPRYLYH